MNRLKLKKTQFLSKRSQIDIVQAFARATCMQSKAARMPIKISAQRMSCYRINISLSHLSQFELSRNIFTKGGAKNEYQQRHQLIGF